MFSRRTGKKVYLILGVNLILLVFAVWLALRFQSESPSAQHKHLSKTLASKTRSLKHFPITKIPPSLKEALEGSQAFISRIDLSKQAPLTKPDPAASPLLAPLVSYRQKRSPFAWNQVRLTGVVMVEEEGAPAAVRNGDSRLMLLSPGSLNQKYAILEFRGSPLLLREGDTHREALRVVRVEPTRVILEAGQETRVIELSGSQSREGKQPRPVSPVLANTPKKKRRHPKKDREDL